MRINLFNRFQQPPLPVKKAETKQQPTTTLKLITNDTFTREATNNTEIAAPQLSLKEKIQALFSKDTLKKITGLFNKLFLNKFMKLLKNEVFDKILALFDKKLFQNIMNFLDKELFSKIKTIIVDTLQGNTQTANTDKTSNINLVA